MGCAPSSRSTNGEDAAIAPIDPKPAEDPLVLGAIPEDPAAEDDEHVIVIGRLLRPKTFTTFPGRTAESPALSFNPVAEGSLSTASASASEAVTAVVPGPGPAQASAEPARELLILHFNDVYNIQERPNEPVGGAARFTSAIKAEARLCSAAKCIPGLTQPTLQGPDALLLFSGDAFNPSMMSTMMRGRQMPPVLNGLGIHTACVGNHDFDFGLEALVSLSGACNFPWLLANVLDKATGLPLGGFAPTRLVEWCGRKIGLVGLVEQEWLATLSTVSEESVTFLDFVAEGRRRANELRAAGAELIIALTHMRVPNDERLAAEAPEIDLVLGGHDHDYYTVKVPPRGTPLIKSGTDFRELTRIRVAFPAGAARPEVIGWSRIEVNRTIPEDAAMKAIVAVYEAKCGGLMDNVIGETNIALDGKFASIRTGESNLGNLVCDVWRLAASADVALLNSGTLRSDDIHGPGKLRIRDLVSILPMMDTTCVLGLCGADLLAALENGVSMFPKLEGRFPQVSGVAFEFDGTLPPGARITPGSVVVGGMPLDVGRTYRVATKEYLAQGKDGYGALANGVVLVNGEDSVMLPTIMRNMFTELSVLNGFRLVSTVNKAAARFHRLMLHGGSARGGAPRRNSSNSGLGGSNSSLMSDGSVTAGHAPSPFLKKGLDGHYAIVSAVEGRIRRKVGEPTA